MQILMGPCGKLIQGHVLDCAKAPLEAKMREHDAQLYVKWNPKKLRGHGLWEVRRRPEHKLAKHIAKYKGNTYILLDYVENDFTCHIMDTPFLNYKLIEKLKQIDTWNDSFKAKDFGKELEYKEAKIQDKIMSKAEDDKNYTIKQNKSEIRGMMEYVLAGGDPTRIADVWDKV